MLYVDDYHGFETYVFNKHAADIAEVPSRIDQQFR